MRILLVTPFAPDPEARHGGGAFLGTLATALATEARLGLACLAGAAETQQLAGDPGQFAWVGTAPAVPRPRGVGRLGMLWRWRRMPLVAAKFHNTELNEVLRRAIAEFGPDVALVEMAQMAQYLPALSGVPTILTDHEAGCPANTATGLGALGDARDRRLWRRFVRHYYPLATAVQALTPEDAAALSTELAREVTVRPPVFPVPASAVQPARTPPRALFLGDYAHGPNPEAAERLVREVLPRLRAAAPETELWLAGPNQQRIAALDELPGVRVLGYVPDLHGLLGEVRLMLAPLFSGAGFRVKCLAALAHGLPVVTNALGARGLDVPTTARAVVEGSDALATASLTWLQSPERAGEAGRAAHEWATQNVRAEAVARHQIERIAGLAGIG